MSVFIGVLIAFVIALLVVFGIFAPVLSVVFGLGELSTSDILPMTLMVFAAAFSFYFGGMAAGYRATNRRALHGAIVGVAAFAISPILNLATGQGPFPRIDSTGAVLLLVLIFAVSVGAGYIGGRRGAALYEYNQKYSRKPRKATGSKSE
ncbi:MAG: YrzE family protein [Rubrobacter sp.]|jgi:putative membrane protein (TIGR04086 family)|nr:YrzE family protein [Rubrobacter sp.]